MIEVLHPIAIHDHLGITDESCVIHQMDDFKSG